MVMRTDPPADEHTVVRSKRRATLESQVDWEVNATKAISKPVRKSKFDHEILLLQGGGALGAYQAGVYEGLAARGHAPTWLVGISIGAVTSALIVGNPPERRVERLRAFWDRVSSYAPFIWPVWFDPMRSALNHLSAGSVAMFGTPGFFTPRVPPPFFAQNGGPEATSFYDTAPLKDTLEEMVDFDLINRGDMRISLGAVNVRTGRSVYFDNQKTRIGPEHVMASGALPPGFPAIEIEGEYYWDGGLVSNSPLNYVWDERPLTTALIMEVDLFKATGELPRNLDQVLERTKDIQYSSKQRVNIDHAKEIGELRGALKRLLSKLPSDLKADPDAEKLVSICDNREWTIARLINQRLPNVSQTKDYEFSRATVEEHWAAGLEDVRRSAANREWIEPTEIGQGVRFYDLPVGTGVIVP
jgi:NTE family protein